MDECEGPIPVVFQEVSDGGICPEVLTRTWTATDGCGNTTIATQRLTVVDTTAPELSGVPMGLSVECVDEIPAPADVSATDNCDAMVAVVFSETSDGLTCPETITRTWTATDRCGNVVSGTQTIVINDTIAPVLSGVPMALSVECVDEIPAPADVSATDNCDAMVAVEFSETSDGLTCPETITRTWTATDRCGNVVSGTQTIVINDTIAPVLSGVPMGLSVECVDEIPAPADVSATDNCDAMVAVEFSETSDGLICPETITRTWTATDRCGNVVSGSQTIVVNDTTPPELTVQGPMTVSGDSNCEYLLGELGFEARDNCDSELMVVQTPVAGTKILGPGTTVVTISVTDACSNRTEKTVEITVECLGAIGDRVWLDENANGIQEGGEQGIEGVEVELFDSAGVSQGTTLTDVDGMYLFVDLLPGDYYVEFTIPAGFEVSPLDANGNADDSVDSDVDPVTGRTMVTRLEPNEVDLSWDLGLYEPARLGDLVWIDTNGDGEQGEASVEPGVEGVTVNVLDAGGWWSVQP